MPWYWILFLFCEQSEGSCYDIPRRGWYVPNVLTHSGSKAWQWHSHLRGDSTFWNSVEKPCHLLQWVLKFHRYSWSSSLSLHQASSWAFNTALAFAVPPGLNTIAWKTYFIFGSSNFAAFLQVCFMYPETVGRSLEEVEEIFSQGHTFTGWKIGKNVGMKTLKEVE